MQTPAQGIEERRRGGGFCRPFAGHVRRMTPVTYEQAAAILGCHVSNVPKLIRKGQLTAMALSQMPLLTDRHFGRRPSGHPQGLEAS
jgi:hypothetical protein